MVSSCLNELQLYFTAGTKDTTLTIEGTLFSTVIEQNHVKVGTADCIVSSATATEIVCDLQEGELGMLEWKF